MRRARACQSAARRTGRAVAGSMGGMTTTPPDTLLPRDRATVPVVLGARGLTKTYDATHALADLSLDLRAGESVAVMGPSGGGKSTLLHCLAGIITPDASISLY